MADNNILDLINSFSAYGESDAGKANYNNLGIINPNGNSNTFGVNTNQSPFLPGYNAGSISGLMQNQQMPNYMGMNNGLPVMSAPGNDTGGLGFGSLSGWGDAAAGIGSILNYFNGRAQVDLGKQQLKQQDENFNKNFDYAKELSEERRNRHNRLRARYS